MTKSLKKNINFSNIFSANTHLAKGQKRLMNNGGCGNANGKESSIHHLHSKRGLFL